MGQPFPSHHKDFADGMGISMYQVFSLEDASSFLSSSLDSLRVWAESGDIACVRLPEGEVQFFGYQLIGYLLKHTTPQPPVNEPINTTERIIRSNEVLELTSLSRSTLHRYEKYGKFPKRIKLGARNVGWKFSEVQEWIRNRAC